MSVPVVVRGATVEDLLGPARARFFGEGYRRTRPRLRSMTVTHDGSTSSLTAWGAVSPGEGWSVKDGRQQRPHLATTDVVALLAQAVGALLSARFDPATADVAVITGLDVQASDRPAEDGLDGLPVTVTLEAGIDGTAFRGAVGPMRVSGTVDRPMAVASMAEVTAPGETPVAPPGAPYGELLERRTQRLLDVTVVDGAARATSRIEDSCDGVVPHGLESAQQPAYTMVDAFVATLQLGQVLLYDLDGVDRGASGTLWMRRTSVRAAGPVAATGPVPVSVELERARTVERDGGPWRMADVVGRVGAIEVRCAVAHRLPTRPGPSTDGPGAAAGPTERRNST